MTTPVVDRSKTRPALFIAILINAVGFFAVLMSWRYDDFLGWLLLIAPVLAISFVAGFLYGLITFSKNGWHSFYISLSFAVICFALIFLTGGFFGEIFSIMGIAAIPVGASVIHLGSHVGSRLAIRNYKKTHPGEN